MSQDSTRKVYVVHVDALTCLGQGIQLQQNIQKGESGLFYAKEVYPDWFSKTHFKIGCITQLSDSVNRIQSLLERLFTDENIEILDRCEKLICGSALGDLTNSTPGRPNLSFSDSLQRKLKNPVPHYVISSACSSGTDALSIGYLSIAKGQSNLVGIIAADSLDPFKLIQHLELKTQSPDWARPFSIDRNGTSFGEGAALIVLASESVVENFTPMAKILGVGMSCDAKDITAPDQSGYYPSLAVSRALKMAQISPNQVGYINAHGSGTVLNDLAESQAYKRIFGEHLLSSIPVSSTKGAVGHLLGATGLVEASFLSWAIQDQKLPHTAGHINPDPELGLKVLKQGQSEEANFEIGLSVTLGFGGVNSCVVMSRC